MRRNATWKRENLAQFFQTSSVLRDVWIDFGVAAVQIRIRHHDLAAMPWSFNVEHIHIVFIDGAIQMRVDKVLTWNSAPVSDWVRFHIVRHQRRFEQWIVFQIHLRYGNIVGSTPPSIYFAQIFGRIKLRFVCHYERSTFFSVVVNLSLYHMPFRGKCLDVN